MALQVLTQLRDLAVSSRHVDACFEASEIAIAVTVDEKAEIHRHRSARR